MCELRLLACVKDLLSRLLSMIQVSSGFSLLYSNLQQLTASKDFLILLLPSELSFFVAVLVRLTTKTGCRGEDYTSMSQFYYFILILDWSYRQGQFWLDSTPLGLYRLIAKSMLLLIYRWQIGNYFRQSAILSNLCYGIGVLHQSVVCRATKRQRFLSLYQPSLYLPY